VVATNKNFYKSPINSKVYHLLFGGYFIMEEWKKIETHPQYEISSLGNLRHKINKSNLKFCKNKKGK